MIHQVISKKGYASVKSSCRVLRFALITFLILVSAVLSRAGSEIESGEPAVSVTPDIGEPVGWSPVGIDFFAQLPSDDYAIYGARIGLIGMHRRMTGVSLCLLSNLDDVASWCLRVGLVNYAGKSSCSFDVSLLGNLVMPLDHVPGQTPDETVMTDIGSGGSSSGVQLSGLGNCDFCNYNGMQLGGLLNISGNFNGVQIAGLFNNAKSMNGVQIAGLSNISDDTAGVQVAGVLNSAKDCIGFQIGLMNSCEKLCGVQVGLINLAENGVGLQLGLMNSLGDDTIPLIGIRF